MPRKADPRCPLCGGKGGSRYGNSWRKCSCVNGTAAQRAAVRRLHSTGALRDPTRSLMDTGTEQLALDITEGAPNDLRATTTVHPANQPRLPADDRPTQHRRFCACFDCTETRYGTVGAFHYYGWQPPAAPPKPHPNHD